MKVQLPMLMCSTSTPRRITTAALLFVDRGISTRTCASASCPWLVISPCISCVWHRCKKPSPT
ncbi:unnamed protein product [Symbiodinium pilosum]|uniref:Uncharacterized protein n=1 Tax=Symbiodinium pilosum TaxID=2952 RepID=A0A812P7B9_SYMPI|nr:unnamed protein product [Symbiodinium pilosum]